MGKRVVLLLLSLPCCAKVIEFFVGERERLLLRGPLGLVKIANVVEQVELIMVLGEKSVKPIKAIRGNNKGEILSSDICPPLTSEPEQ